MIDSKKAAMGLGATMVIFLVLTSPMSNVLATSNDQNPITKSSLAMEVPTISPGCDSL